jgi:hypothetical protein
MPKLPRVTDVHWPELPDPNKETSN